MSWELNEIPRTSEETRISEIERLICDGAPLDKIITLFVVMLKKSDLPYSGYFEEIWMGKQNEEGKYIILPSSLIDEIIEEKISIFLKTKEGGFILAPELLKTYKKVLCSKILEEIGKMRDEMEVETESGELKVM